MKQILNAVAVAVTLTGMPFQAFAENPFERTIKDAISDKINKTMGTPTSQPLEKILKDVFKIPKVSRDNGYCQVWRNNELIAVRSCKARRVCDEKTKQCTHTYKWQNAKNTTIESHNGQPFSMNGGPVTTVNLAGDTCVLDSKQEIFCFTHTPQASDLMQSQKSLASIDTSAEPVEAEGSAENPQFEMMLDSYYETLDGDDSASIKKRCDIGLQLVGRFRSEMEPGTLTLVKDQIRLDKCLG